MSAEPTYYLFLAGDPCPTWIERLETDAWDARVEFVAETEVLRYPDRVEIRPLFPLTDERPYFLNVIATGCSFCRVIGGPTTVLGWSRHFPHALPPDLAALASIEWNEDWKP